MGFRFGPVMVQPEVSAVATSSVSTTFPPAASIEVIFHVPAISASESAAGAAGVSGAMAAVSIAVPSLAARFSDLAQAASMAAQQNRARRCISSSRLGFNFAPAASSSGAAEIDRRDAARAELTLDRI